MRIEKSGHPTSILIARYSVPHGELFGFNNRFYVQTNGYIAVDVETGDEVRTIRINEEVHWYRNTSLVVR